MRGATYAFCCWLCLTLLGCTGTSPKLDLSGSNSGAALMYPAKETSDRVALCDNAPLGMPCGKRGSQMYCIAQVCVRNVCGDGVKAELEECDDGNQRDGDACSAQCRSAGASVCGNGKVELAEACDDGNDNEQDGCDSRCRLSRNTPVSEAGKGMTPAQAGAASGQGGMMAAAGVGGSAGELVAAGSGGGPVLAGSGGAGGAGGASAGPVPSAACAMCRDTHCRSYGQLDVVSGCLERIDVTQGADAQDFNFIDDCRQVVACAIAQRCADTIFGVASCYCGTTQSSACAANGPGPGQCLAEIQRATRSADPTEIMLRMRSKSIPMGWAFDLLECDRLHCLASCRP